MLQYVSTLGVISAAGEVRRGELAVRQADPPPADVLSQDTVLPAVASLSEQHQQRTTRHRHSDDSLLVKPTPVALGSQLQVVALTVTTVWHQRQHRVWQQVDSDDPLAPDPTIVDVRVDRRSARLVVI